jgi:PAS domain S-box-containing protein
MTSMKRKEDDEAPTTAEQEQILQALRNHELDAVVGSRSVLLLRLKEAEDELKIRNRLLEESLEERKRGEEALRESEERYRTLFDSMTEGFALHEIITDEQGRPVDYRFLDVNPAFERLTGLKRADLIGKPVLEVLPGTEPYWIEDFGRVALSGEPVHVSRHSAALGRWYEVFAYRTGTGRFAVVFTDITERKKAEEAVAAAHKQVQSIIDNTTSIAYAFDLEERFLLANATLAELLNSTPEQMIGKRRQDFMPKDDADWHEANDRQVIETGRALEFEEYSRLKGRSITWLTTKFPLRDAQGRIYAVGGISADVSERKRAEERLRASKKRLKALSKELDLRVRERTAELERKNRELQEFAFVASHDLSEPLRKIQTFGSLLFSNKAAQLDHEARDYVSRMTKAANRMQELLEALLRYSRVETKGKKFKPTNLNDVVRRAASDLEVLIREAGARIEISTLPSVDGDEAQLRQLFQNFIINALKYRREGAPPFIRIYGEEEDGRIRAYVEDDGIGFDEKYLEKIFQPFQRLHGRSEYPGLGMGLAICRKIVERHGGTITARSTPGSGSTFIVTLPVSPAKSSSASQQPFLL